MFRKIMMGTALMAAVAAFDPSAAMARNGGGHGGGGGGHMGGGGGAHFGGGGGAHFGGGGFARGGGGFHSFASHGGGMHNSFASANPGVMRNATVNRSFNNNARVSQNMQFHHWNNGGHHHGGRHHRGWWGYGAGLALGYGLYDGYYDDPYAYYDDDYYGNYAYNDDYADQCYRAQRYHTRSGWHVRTVNVCQ
jgi:hypothetical protein